jgi:hypothetical protein
MTRVCRDRGSVFLSLYAQPPHQTSSDVKARSSHTPTNTQRPVSDWHGRWQLQ